MPAPPLRISTVPSLLICPDSTDPSNFAVTVTPDDSAVTYPQNTSGHTAQFTGTDRVVQAELTTFKEFVSGQILPYKHYVLNSASPLP